MRRLLVRGGWGGLLFGVLVAGCGASPPPRPLAPGNYEGEPAMEVLPELDVPEETLGERFRFAWRLAAEALELRPPRPPVAPTAAELQAWSDGPLKEWLQEKSRRVEAARKEWDRVAEQGRRQRIVAGAVVGLLYEDVARALLDVPVPAELSNDPEIAEVYREVVLFQARPYLTHARRAYHACAANAVRPETMHHWGRFCARRGERLPHEGGSQPVVPVGGTVVTVEPDYD